MISFSCIFLFSDWEMAWDEKGGQACHGWPLMQSNKVHNCIEHNSNISDINADIQTQWTMPRKCLSSHVMSYVMTQMVRALVAANVTGQAINTYPSHTLINYWCLSFRSLSFSTKMSLKIKFHPKVTFKSKQMGLPNKKTSKYQGYEGSRSRISFFNCFKQIFNVRPNSFGSTFLLVMKTSPLPKWYHDMNFILNF